MMKLFPSSYSTATIKVAAAGGIGGSGFHLSCNECGMPEATRKMFN